VPKDLCSPSIRSISLNALWRADGAGRARRASR
jgi:hypothetical protein